MQTIDFFPFPALIGLLVLAGVSVHLRTRGGWYLLGLALLGLYLLTLAAVMFFPIPLPENWPANLTWPGTWAGLRSVNLIPFNYRWQTEPRDLVIEIGRNILLSAPFGLLAAFLAGQDGPPFRGRRLLWTALSVGLALEGAQLLLKLITGLYIRTVDINDVLLNALGVLVGASMYHAAARAVRRIQG